AVPARPNAATPALRHLRGRPPRDWEWGCAPPRGSRLRTGARPMHKRSTGLSAVYAWPPGMGAAPNGLGGPRLAGPPCGRAAGLLAPPAWPSARGSWGPRGPRRSDGRSGCTARGAARAVTGARRRTFGLAAQYLLLGGPILSSGRLPPRRAPRAGPRGEGGR